MLKCRAVCIGVKREFPPAVERPGAWQWGGRGWLWVPYLDLGTQGIAAELKPNLVIALKHEWEVLRGHNNTHRL